MPTHRCLDTIRLGMKAHQWDVDAMTRLKATHTTPEDYVKIHDWSGFPGGGFWLLVRVIHNSSSADAVLSIIQFLNDAAAATHDVCKALVNMAMIPLLIEKLHDEEEGVPIREEAARGLSIIAKGHSAAFYDVVYSSLHSIASVILKGPLLHAKSRSHITRVIAKMCNPRPPAERVAELMEYFTQVLTKLTSAREAGEVEAEEVEGEIIDILNGISNATDSTGGGTHLHFGIDVLPLVISVLSVPVGKEEPGYGDAPVVERLVPCEQMAYAMEYLPRADLERLCMLNSDIWNCCVCANRRLYNRVRSTVCHRREVRVPAVRIIGNVMNGSDAQTQAAIDCGALRVMEGIIASLRPIDVTDYTKDAAGEWRELCWILSNVAAGTVDQVRLILQSNIFYNFVTEALCMTAVAGVMREVAFTVGNALQLLPKMVPLGWIAALFAYFAVIPPTSADMVQIANDVLDGLIHLCPELPTSLTAIRASVTSATTPENLLLQADTFTRDDCAGSATDKLTPLMRDHVLPVLYAAGKLDGNDHFAFSDGEEEGIE